MKWSWKIGELAGIGIYLHATFLILLGWVLLSHLVSGYTLTAALLGLLFMVAIFACIVLHELGHALAARKYGIPTRDITLLPIGGVARLERMPDDPKQELVVALAGPAVNVLIAFSIYLWFNITQKVIPLEALGVAVGSFAARIFYANIFLVIFNLIPAFPMDGGRVLRALLAMKLDYTRATQIAATIGQGLAFLFGFVGLFSSNPFLLFIAFFVWIGAAQEGSMVQMRSALGGIPLRHAMITSFHELSPRDPLNKAVQYILAGFQQDFPVTDNGRVVGILTRGDLLSALAAHGEGGMVSEAMQRDFLTADPREMLEPVFARLQACDCRTIPVVHQGTLVGIVTLDNVSELLMIQQALSGKRVQEAYA
jgi:Zn-dependent protease